MSVSIKLDWPTYNKYQMQFSTFIVAGVGIVAHLLRPPVSNFQHCAGYLVHCRVVHPVHMSHRVTPVTPDQVTLGCNIASRLCKTAHNCNNFEKPRVIQQSITLTLFQTYLATIERNGPLFIKMDRWESQPS